MAQHEDASPPQNPGPNPSSDSSAPDVAWAFRLLNASTEGLLKIIEGLNPKYAERYGVFLEQLSHELDIRDARDRDAASAWLLEQLRDARLPDLRKTKSYKEEFELVRRYDALKEKLGPVFKSTTSVHARKVRAAPIVKEITGQEIRPHQLPDPRNLARFCHGLLGTNPVRVSRARRRGSLYLLRLGYRLLDRVDALFSGQFESELRERVPEELIAEARRRWENFKAKYGAHPPSR